MWLPSDLRKGFGMAFRQGLQVLRIRGSQGKETQRTIQRMARYRSPDREGEVRCSRRVTKYQGPRARSGTSIGSWPSRAATGWEKSWRSRKRRRKSSIGFGASRIAAGCREGRNKSMCMPLAPSFKRARIRGCLPWDAGQPNPPGPPD